MQKHRNGPDQEAIEPSLTHVDLEHVYVSEDEELEAMAHEAQPVEERDLSQRPSRELLEAAQQDPYENESC